MTFQFRLRRAGIVSAWTCLAIAAPSAAAAGAALVPPVQARTSAPADSAPDRQEPSTDPAQLVTEGRRLIGNGNLDGGIALIQRALKIDSKSVEANLALGIALDIKGRYADARTHLEQAMTLADDNAREPAISAMAISYVFEGDIANAARYYQMLFDRQMSESRLDAAAATANAMGRIYLESGDVAKAEQWYATGRDTAQKLSNLPGDQVDLWAMRWHHAQARIAARRGDLATAERETTAVKTLVDKNEQNAREAPIYYYLAGYTALYAGNNDAALAALAKGDQRDPFVLGLMAQAYDKKKDKANAKAFYDKALESPAHTIQNALTRTIAEQRLAALAKEKP